MPKSETFRLTVPSDDPEVIAWCKNQRRNMSLSIRLLIQQEIRKNGIGNMFATDRRISPENANSVVNEPARKQNKTTKRQKNVQNTEPSNDFAQPTQPTTPPNNSGGVSDADFQDMMMN